MSQELSGQALQDVHKMVYLAREYPKKTIKELTKLFELSALDINNALWRAQDMNYLIVDEETKLFTVDTVPEAWDFGEDVDFLKEQLVYAFNHLARDEADMEETYLGNWTRGYPVHDLSIAIKQLLEDRVLATYEIGNNVDVKPGKPAKGQRTDTYVFYCLYENMENRWGTKQFPDKARLS